MESRELQVETPFVLKQSSFENIEGFDCVGCENGNDINLLGNTVCDEVRIFLVSHFVKYFIQPFSASLILLSLHILLSPLISHPSE
jgi:hypothetical protein